MTDGLQARVTHRSDEPNLETTQSASADALLGAAVRRTQLEFLDKNIEDIKILRDAARKTPLREDDLREAPTFRRGAVGVAVMEHEIDLLNRQLPRWETYFSNNIDNLLAGYELLRSGTTPDPRAVDLAYEASSNILAALQRTLAVRLAS